jgi:hypothetical protein
MSERWLLMTNHLCAPGGSELVVMELAEALVASGARVTVFASAIKPEFVHTLVESGVTVVDEPKVLDPCCYDVIYVQHATLGLTFPVVGPWPSADDPPPVLIFNHLSPFEPFEAPGAFIERRLGDIVLANSPETGRRLGEFGLDPRRIVLWPNPAPAAFESVVSSRPDLGRLLIVSSHVPREVREAAAQLAQAGVRISVIGRHDRFERLRPSDLADHDAVLTIGKTVQYALRARRPVFCYDHFGGPGWLGPDITKAADQNFSGRSHPHRLSSDAMAEAIRSGYRDAKDFAEAITPEALRPYCLEHALAGLRARIADVLGDSDRSRRFRERFAEMLASGEPALERTHAELIRREYLEKQEALRQLAVARSTAAAAQADGAGARRRLYTLTDGAPGVIGRCNLDWSSGMLHLCALDDDPRIMIPVEGGMTSALLVEIDIVLEQAETVQFFTATAGAVDGASRIDRSIPEGGATITAILAREAPISLLRIDPLSRPGVALIRRLDVFALG